MKNRDNEIIDLYINHLEYSIKDIAKMFNVSCATISRIARINNLPRRTGSSGTKLSIEQVNKIKTEYEMGIPLIQLQKTYSISYDRLKSLLKDCVVVSAAKRLNPQLNEEYFEQIDSNEKAYWLGWIVSDGSLTDNIEKSKFSLELTIKKEDEDILHLLENDLGVKNKIYPSQKHYSRFCLGSKKIITDLNKLGITSNKTFSVKVPKFDKKYNAAFIRGIFDGDGGFSVYTRKSGQHCQELSFCGNEFVISWIRDTLIAEIPELTPNSITQESSIKRIRWSSLKDIKLIRDYMYKEHNNHYLSRKYNLIYVNTEVTN